VLKSPARSSFLFLQGPASLFFSRLAAALHARGHQVARINFNGGDRAFWHHRGGVDFLDTAQNFPAFLARQFSERGITDIVLLGDCRPLHKLAIEAARVSGIKAHIFEEGYIRPNWVTLEQFGVNGFSALPRDIAAFTAAAALLAPHPPPVEILSRLPRRALDDVIYSSATALMAWRYRNYKRHWPYGQLQEYFYGGRRVLARMIRRRARERNIQDIIYSGSKYYVFPMQVDVDSQIIFHSAFNGQAEVLRLILESFSRQAPPDSLLVITEHPLETSPTNWRKVVAAEAAACGVSARVRFIPGGSPTELLMACRGIIVVNSTTGHQGLELGIPVIALSRAVFNIPGVTFQDGLDRFWTQAQPADFKLVDAFRQVVIDRTQLNGGFFSRQGMALAVANAVPQIEAASCKTLIPQPDRTRRFTPIAAQVDLPSAGTRAISL
jgi:capsular polysaccharide export protein